MMVPTLVSLCSRLVVSDHSSSPSWFSCLPRELYSPLLDAALSHGRPLAVGQLIQQWPERSLRLQGEKDKPPSRACVQALLLAVERGLKDTKFRLQTLDLCGLQCEDRGVVDSMGSWSLTLALCSIILHQRCEGKRFLSGAFKRQRAKEGNVAKGSGPTVRVLVDLFVNGRSWERLRSALGTDGQLKLHCRYLCVEELPAASMVELLSLLPPQGLLGLDVRYSSLGMAGVTLLLPVLARLPQLRSLRLHYCNVDLRREAPGQQEALRNMATGLANLRQLTGISFTALRLGGHLRLLLSSLARPLEVLELPYLSLTPCDLSYLSCSDHASSLRWLDLSENKLQEECLSSLQRLLTRASLSLRHLSLCGCHLTDGPLAALLLPWLASFGSGVCCSLRSLGLALNPLSRQAVRALVRAAAGVPTLCLLLHPNPLEEYEPPLPPSPSSAQMLDWPLNCQEHQAFRTELDDMLLEVQRPDLMVTSDMVSFSSLSRSLSGEEERR